VLPSIGGNSAEPRQSGATMAGANAPLLDPIVTASPTPQSSQEVIGVGAAQK
jgi:hypothetical protein